MKIILISNKGNIHFGELEAIKENSEGIVIDTDAERILCCSSKESSVEDIRAIMDYIREEVEKACNDEKDKIFINLRKFKENRINSSIESCNSIGYENLEEQLKGLEEICKRVSTGLMLK